MTKRVRTTRRLEVWLKDTSVALFVLNSYRRLVFFNVGCEQLTGWTPADVLGQVCDFVSEPDSREPSALLASLAPPNDVWQGRTTTVPAFLARRESEPISCVIHYYPLTDTDHKVEATLGIIQHATAKQKGDHQTVSQRLHAELAFLRHSLREKFSEVSLIGRSPAIKRLMEQMKLAKQSTMPLLFVGESGTGREYMARLVHQRSESGRRTFVPLDCRRLSAEQLESTLQRIESSDQTEAFQPGTVYLDHVESLPRDIQRLVLNLIDSQSPSKPRLIASSFSSLDPFVEKDDFLRDLNFRLTSLVVFVPPLRNRTDDLEPLAQYFLEELNRGDSRQINGFHDDVWQQFQRYDWPGNVRELREVVTEARQNCSGALIETSHLPIGFRAGVDRQSLGPAIRRKATALDPLLLKVEREQIEMALTEARGNKAKAADLLGITRPRLYRRMEILGIVDDEPASDTEG